MVKSMLFLSAAFLMAGSFLSAYELKKCQCRNCICTPDRNCGCHSDRGCHCDGHTCSMNDDCDEGCCGRPRR